MRRLECFNVLRREQQATTELDERDLAPCDPPPDQMNTDSKPLCRLGQREVVVPWRSRRRDLRRVRFRVLLEICHKHLSKNLGKLPDGLFGR